MAHLQFHKSHCSIAKCRSYVPCFITILTLLKDYCKATGTLTLFYVYFKVILTLFYVYFKAISGLFSKVISSSSQFYACFI